MKKHEKTCKHEWFADTRKSSMFFLGYVMIFQYQPCIFLGEPLFFEETSQINLNNSLVNKQ